MYISIYLSIYPSIGIRFGRDLDAEDGEGEVAALAHPGMMAMDGYIGRYICR